MEVKVTCLRYSIFGDYNYINNTPETVSKLYEQFESDKFMPNILTILNIEDQNNAHKIERPQLVNNNLPSTITILPDRLDIEVEAEIELDQIIDYFDRLINMFELKINRLALNKSTILRKIEFDTSEKLKKFVAPPENYNGEGNVIEFASHRTCRKKLNCFDELININRNLTGVPSSDGNENIFDQLKVDTDINTLSENSKYRFNINHILGFFKEALECDDKILGNMVAFINEG